MSGDIPHPYRLNSNFQIKHFIAGSRHTPDGKYVELMQMKEALEHRLTHNKAAGMRHIARLQEIENHLSDLDQSKRDQLKKQLLEADKVEHEGDQRQWLLASEALKSEYEYVCRLIQEILPSCQYAQSMPFLEVCEKIQEEEWALELKTRAEEFIASQGLIPHDHLRAMRQHPRYKELIFPRIVELTNQAGACPDIYYYIEGMKPVEKLGLSEKNKLTFRIAGSPST